jgi:hypothetical protein
VDDRTTEWKFVRGKNFLYKGEVKTGPSLGIRKYDNGSEYRGDLFPSKFTSRILAAQNAFKFHYTSYSPR